MDTIPGILDASSKSVFRQILFARDNIMLKKIRHTLLVHIIPVVFLIGIMAFAMIMVNQRLQ